MKISVIIPSYRRFLPLINTIQDVKKQDYDDFEIIVVDQNPVWPEEYQSALTEIRQDARVIWLTLDKPEVVIARNMAAQCAKGDILLFIDDDVKIPDNLFLTKHAANFQDESIDVVSGRECTPQFIPDTTNTSLKNPSDYKEVKNLSPLQQTLWFDRNSEYRAKVCTFSTCNGAIRKSVFLEVGGFDENFRGNSYGDDYDLILRLHQLGRHSVYDTNAWLIHLRVPMGGLRMSDLKNQVNYITTATGFWLFLLRHGNPTMYWHLFFHHVLRKTVLLKVNLQRPWRQLFVIPGLILAFFRAAWLLRRGCNSCFTISS